MGLPGSGKTYFSRILCKEMNSIHLNADNVRKKFNDWDFSRNGRIRQAKRMRALCENLLKKKIQTVIADFVCPTVQTRKEFKPTL